MLPECNPPCPQRDEMEQLLFAEVMHLGKPIFAICRGIQIVNVFLGGTLIQDIPSQTGSEVAHSQPPPYSRPSHDITVEPGTPLYELFGRDTLPVNSDHHQCVKDLAPSLAIMARCKDDGLTEAVYMPDKPFVWGVQWHPECALDDPASHALFKKFVDACMKK
jgi:putative glutamine amidotransferase